MNKGRDQQEVLGCNRLLSPSPNPKGRERNQRISVQLSPVIRLMFASSRRGPSRRPCVDPRKAESGRGQPSLDGCQRGGAAGIARGFHLGQQPQGRQAHLETAASQGGKRDRTEKNQQRTEKNKSSVPLWQDRPCSAEPGISPAPCLSAERLTVVPRRPICTSKGAIWRQVR